MRKKPTPKQSKLLRTLYENPSICSSDLAKLLNMGKSSLSNMIAFLDSSDLIIKNKQGKYVYLTLSEKGRQIVEAIEIEEMNTMLKNDWIKKLIDWIKKLIVSYIFSVANTEICSKVGLCFLKMGVETVYQCFSLEELLFLVIQLGLISKDNSLFDETDFLQIRKILLTPEDESVCIQKFLKLIQDKYFSETAQNSGQFSRKKEIYKDENPETEID